MYNKKLSTSALLLTLFLCACGVRSLPGNINPAPGPADPSEETPELAQACAPGQLCAGSAKRAINPTQAQVEGIEEERLPGTTVSQDFHLGGFGFGPFEAAELLDSLTGSVIDERLCVGETCVSNAPASRPYHCKDFSVSCTPDSDLAELTWVRSFYLSQPDASGAGTELVFVTLDAIGAGNLVIGAIKAAVREATGIPEDNVIVGMTHSHAGADLQGLWGGVPQEWVQGTLVAGAAQAALEAKTQARAATLNYARGHDAAFNNYRRPRIFPDAETDTLLSVLQARDSTSAVIGTLVQYAAHPTAIGASSGGDLGRAVHPDYVLGLEDTIEAATGGATAIYYNGPIADASGSGPTEGEDDYQRVRSRGTCLARSALALLSPVTSPCDFSELQRADVFGSTLSPSLEVSHATVLMPVTNPLFLVLGLAESFNRFYNFTPLPLEQIPIIGGQLAAQQPNLPQLTPTASTLVSRVTIGGAEQGLEIVTIPGEATNTFGQYIRGLTANPNMMLFGLTQNSYGYLIPEEEFNYIDVSGDAGLIVPFTGYEEFVSLGPLSAAMLRLQGYNPLFGIPMTDPRNLPPSVTACIEDPTGRACLLTHTIAKLDYAQRAYSRLCLENLPESAAAFCALLDPQTPLYEPCVAAGLPETACAVFGKPAG